MSVMCGWTWPEGHGESSRIMAGADARPKAAAAVCSAEQWCARSTRHRGRAVWCCFLADVGWLLLLDLCLTKYSFRLIMREGFYMGGMNIGWLAVWVPSPNWLRRKSEFVRRLGEAAATGKIDL